MIEEWQKIRLEVWYWIERQGINPAYLIGGILLLFAIIEARKFRNWKNLSEQEQARLKTIALSVPVALLIIILALVGVL